MGTRLGRRYEGGGHPPKDTPRVPSQAKFPPSPVCQEVSGSTCGATWTPGRTKPLKCVPKARKLSLLASLWLHFFRFWEIVHRFQRRLSRNSAEKRRTADKKMAVVAPCLLTCIRGSLRRHSTTSSCRYTLQLNNCGSGPLLCTCFRDSFRKQSTSFFGR